jgi:hypothetical protein
VTAEIDPDLLSLRKGKRLYSALLSCAVQQLKIVGALLDKIGNLVAAKEGITDFALTDPTSLRLFESGVNALFTLEALPGKCRLRAVVQ